MPSSAVEDYLKQIYLMQPGGPDLVSMGKLASAMGVVPGTATSMIKTLADSGLVQYEPRGGVRLTHNGEQLAPPAPRGAPRPRPVPGQGPRGGAGRGAGCASRSAGSSSRCTCCGATGSSSCSW